eukprot:Sspe_Gene.40827::Locus_19724_Transcript_1_1_Confidence_1.000_Length_4075::g.40827::m.40827
MGDLPPELLNRVNRGLKSRVAELEKAISAAQAEKAQHEHWIETEEGRIKELRAQLSDAKALYEAGKQQTEAESRLRRCAEREASKVAADIKAQQLEVEQLQGRAEELEGRIAAAQGRIQKFLDATHLTDAQLRRVIERQHTAEVEAESLSQLTKKEAEEVAKLMAQRDQVAEEVAARREDVEEEMQISEQLHRQAEEVMREMAALQRERGDLLDVYQRAVQAAGASTAQHEALHNTIARISEEKAAKSDEVKLLRERLASLESDAAALERAVEKAGERRNRLPQLLQQHAAEDEEMSTQAELLRGALSKAMESLHRARGEVAIMRGELDEKLRRCEELEDAAAAAADVVRKTTKTLTDEKEWEREVQRLRDDAKRGVERVTATAMLLRERVDEALSRSTAVEGERGELEKTKQQYDTARNRAGREAQGRAQELHQLAQEMWVLEQRHKITQDRLAEATEEYKRREVECLARAKALRDELSSWERQVSLLAGACSGATGAVEKARAEVSEMQTSGEAIRREMAVAKAELQKLASDLSAMHDLRLKYSAELHDVQTTEARLRDRLEDVLSGVEDAETRRVLLDGELMKREREIESYREKRRADYKVAEEERRALVSELQAKQQVLAGLQARHSECMKSLYAAASAVRPEEEAVEEGEANFVRDEDLASMEPEDIHARYITDMAQLRMKLQARGDELDEAIVQAVKDLKRLEKATDRFATSNALKKHEVGQIAWKEPTACELAMVAAGGGSGAEELSGIRGECARVQREIEQWKASIADMEQQHQAAQKALKVQRETLRAATKDFKDTQQALAAETAQRRAGTSVDRPLIVRPPKTERALQRLQEWAVGAAREDRSVYLAFRRLLERAHLDPPPTRRLAPSTAASAPQPKKRSSSRPALVARTIPHRATSQPRGLPLAVAGTAWK